MRTTLAFCLFATVLSAGCTTTPDKSATVPTPAKAKNGVLASASGKTLYTFDKDPAGKSVCNGACAASWPPMYAAPGTKGGGDWSVITRDDGKPQWAWRGKPLYFWHKDLKPGDRLGDGVNGVWHAAKP